jgi:hypothetical protein
MLRKVWSVGLIRYQAKKFNNPNYLSYIFRKKPKGFLKRIIYYFEELLIIIFKSQIKLKYLRTIYLKIARKATFYQKCKEEISQLKPDYIFCTHQRATKATVPLLAAIDIGIKTGTFIYSWDNLPKATLFVEANHYYVWSNYMKDELLKYHSDHVKPNDVYVSGTPQFESYFDERIKISRLEFANQYNLPLDKKWVCFSGDDITTSPYDQVYLYDFCYAVKKWNENTENDKIHVVFRPCPVDFSERYDEVLEKFKGIITLIRPEWSTLNPTFGWNKIIPQKSDISLLVNTVLHCEFVVNLGSTMAFDFSIYNKPAIYLNYSPVNDKIWSVSNIYKFIHFKSMKNLKPVIWADDKNKFNEYIKLALYNKESYVNDCQLWHKIICAQPYDKSSFRIIETIFEQSKS